MVTPFLVPSYHQIQLELTNPAWPSDRTVFSVVGTSLVTFTEQSQTTFPDNAGRLPIILSPADKIIGLKDEEIFEFFKREAPRLGIDTAHVVNYRVIQHPADFYLLSPNMNKLRPSTHSRRRAVFSGRLCPSNLHGKYGRCGDYG